MSRPGRGRAKIVDAQIERRLLAKAAEPRPDRHAQRHIHQADDRAGRDDARFGDADQFGPVGQREFDPVGPVVAIGDGERAAMADLGREGGEQLRVETGLREVRRAHAARRSAVWRISPIMLGCLASDWS
jgi:hypothetical protein